MISIIIVSWNTCDLLRRCLSSLCFELRGLKSEVFLVDNASADGSAAMVAREFPWVHLIGNATNRGFAAANNQALAMATGEYILLLNPDTEVIPGALHTLIKFLDEHPRAGVVAPQLLNPDGSIQRSCREFPTFSGMAYELLGLSRLFPGNPTFRRYKMLDFDHNSERAVDQPEGACLLFRRLLLEQVGNLDEGYFMLFEEVDWCFRVKQAGWQIWFTPSAKVIHHYGQSIKQVKVRMIVSSHRGMYRYWHKHHSSRLRMVRPVVYAGLMMLGYMRIVSHALKGRRSTLPEKASEIEPRTQELTCRTR